MNKANRNALELINNGLLALEQACAELRASLIDEQEELDSEDERYESLDDLLLALGELSGDYIEPGVAHSQDMLDNYPCDEPDKPSEPTNVV